VVTLLALLFLLADLIATAVASAADPRLRSASADEEEERRL
jgi:hypothetical protein